MDAKYYMPLVMLSMIIAGAGNTLGGKWQDKFNVLG
jgi:hypothetical protein